jgi:hypothetical protein
VVELDDGHGDSDGQMVIKCYKLGKKKEKNKMGLKQRYI